jgi:hypothetical protein
MRACLFALLTVPIVLNSRCTHLNSVVRDFWRLEFSGKISESRSMSSKHGDPPTGRDKDMMAGKMCWKPRMACV